MRKLIEQPLPPDTILNVNVPDLPWEQLTGFQAIRLGHRQKSDPITKNIDPRWMANILDWSISSGPELDSCPGTDFHAVRNNYVSVTPSHID